MTFSLMRLTLNVLSLFLLTVPSYEKLIMIRHLPKLENGTKVQNLTCIFEADDRVFVWNDRLNNTANDTILDEGVASDYEFRDGAVINENRVHSIEYPMGPGFNHRWEAFPNYESKGYKLNKSGSIVFSVRGSKDVHLRLGEDTAESNNSCFRITLAKSNKTESSIRNCNDKGETIPMNSSDQSTLKESFVDPYEWRTFILKWDSQKEIEVFSVAMSRMAKKVNNWINVRRLTVEDPTELRFRFHDYNYCRVTKNNTRMKYINERPKLQGLRIKAIVSLCSDCQFDYLFTCKNNVTLVQGTISSNKTVMPYNLPLWQLKDIEMPSGKTCNPPFTLWMITKIYQNKSKGWWAVNSIRFYQSDQVRSSTRKFLLSGPMFDFTCQTLSYESDERHIVHSNRNVTKINSFGLKKYLAPWDGKLVSGTSICIPEGCTCPPGLTGAKCNQKCPEGRYGYNCEKICNCGHKLCDSIEGSCSTECWKNYVPPACTTKLGPAKVWCIKETDMRLNYTVKLDEDRIDNLRFQIKKPNAEWINVTLRRQNGTPTWHWPPEAIEILNPSTKYNMRVILNGTIGQQADFNTNCWRPSMPQNFSMIYQYNGTVRLKWKQNPYFWENETGFDVSINLLNSNLKECLTLKLRNEGMMLAVKKVKKYDVKLQLLPAKSNYTFVMEKIDKRDAQKVWYFRPNEVSLANAREAKPGSLIKLIKFKLPYIKNATTQSIFNVVMEGASTCPTVARAITQTHKLDKGEYPACLLRFNVTYEYMIQVEYSWISKLMWLTTIPIIVICALLLYILYLKYRGYPVKISLFSIKYIGSNSNTQQASEPEGSPSNNPVSPEVQQLRSFENFVRRASENGILQQQFMMLPKGLVKSCNYGRLPNNKPKNRYGNLIAYDETRVVLARDSHDIYSDYINANYVQGYYKQKAYIATQGPLPETIVDFWRMIWQEEVRIICMLVDVVETGKNTCEQYWPEIGEEMEYGDIVVLTMSQHIFADYNCRKFLLTKSSGMKSQTVQHLQYTGWPEEGVPVYTCSVVEYVQKLLSIPPGQGPIVVHCSSGTGRTGALILSDICLRCLAAEGTVDVLAEAKKMYSARANMLRNFAQYVLAHLIPTQCLLSAPSKVLCSDVTQEKMEEMKSELPVQIARLAETVWMDKSLRLLEPLRPPAPENVRKNRFPKLTPVGPSLITLTRYPTYDNNSYYISAVSVHGPMIRNQYVASQLPMPSTLTDFWRLIIEKNIELVIILQSSDPEDETYCDVIPRGTTLIPVPYLKVEKEMSSNDVGEYFTTEKLLLTDTSNTSTRTRSITTLTCNWDAGEVIRPPAPEGLVELWRASERIQRDGPALVLCYDGVTGCGLYLALSFMLERMAVEQECDVVLAVRAIRRSRPEFVTSQWQFEYLYDAAVKYVESFQIYNNFTGTITSRSQDE